MADNIKALQAAIEELTKRIAESETKINSYEQTLKKIGTGASQRFREGITTRLEQERQAVAKLVSEYKKLTSMERVSRYRTDPIAGGGTTERNLQRRLSGGYNRAKIGDFYKTPQRNTEKARRNAEIYTQVLENINREFNELSVSVDAFGNTTIKNTSRARQEAEAYNRVLERQIQIRRAREQGTLGSAGNLTRSLPQTEGFDAKNLASDVRKRSLQELADAATKAETRYEDLTRAAENYTRTEREADDAADYKEQ